MASDLSADPPERDSDESLAARIRELILDGSFSPGQRLVEADLTSDFGASRGTVRQALMLLEAQGIVQRAKNRGAWVRQVSIQEAIEITEVRSVLEGLCARKAAEVATDAERAELRSIGEKMTHAVETGDIVGYSETVQDLHARIRQISRQDTAATLLERLKYQSVRHHFRVALLPGRAAVGLREHLDVIEAVCTGTQDLAEGRMRQHLTSVIDALVELNESPAMRRTLG